MVEVFLLLCPPRVVLWLPYRSLSAVGVRQRHGQPLTVPTAGAHPGEGVGASHEGVTAPRGAQDTPGLWNVRVPCGQADREGLSTDSRGRNLTATPSQTSSN